MIGLDHDDLDDDHDPAAPPCDHWDDLVGTVAVGVPAQRHCSVATCQRCVVRSQGWVQSRTGIVAAPLHPYPRT